MKVAIIGAGFAGMAACYRLSLAGYEVTCFDGQGIGEGASGASPGLLHPYPGRFPTRKGEGFAASCDLVAVSAKALGGSVIRSEGIIRLPVGPAQAAHFAKCARRYPDVEEVEGGILLTGGLTIDTKSYLQGLWEASAALGAQFEQRCVEGCPPFDRVVFANGAHVPVEVERVKGQVLVVEWPEGTPPLPYSIIGKKYLVMEGQTCVIGATFEHPFDSPTPNIEEATRELFPVACETVPELEGANVIGCRAGVRAHLPGRKPAEIIQVDERAWAIAGLGSKGLLSHALLAEKLLELWRD